MQKHLRLVNIVLLAVVVLSGYYLYQNWSSFRGEEHLGGGAIEQRAAKNQGNPHIALEGLYKQTPDHSYAFYKEVTEKNLFRPDRKSAGEEDEGTESGSEPSKVLASHRFVLYGVAMVGDEKRALLGYVDVDPESKRRKEKVRSLKVGDVVKDFKVAAIEATSVTLNVDQETVMLGVYDPKSPGTRKSVRTVSTATMAAPQGTLRKRTSAAPPSQASTTSKTAVRTKQSPPIRKR